MDQKIFKAAAKNIAKGQIEALKKSLQANPGLAACKNKEGGTLLHLAAIENKPEAIKCLLEMGAEPDAIDSRLQRSTALHLATGYPFLEVVEILLAAGADPNLKNSLGHTPLQNAAQFSCQSSPEGKDRYESIFFKLLEHGAVVDDPQDIIWRASFGGASKIVEYVFKNIITGQMSDDPNRDAEFNQVNRTQAEMLKMFMEQVQPTAPASENDSPYVKYVKKLFSRAYGKSAARPDETPEPPPAEGLAEIIENELRQKASGAVKFDKSALAQAAKNGYLEIVEMMLAHGAAALRQGAEGRQALVAALENDRLECAQAICQALADQAQKQYDQEHRPDPEEIKKLAQSIYDSNMMAPSCASFILPPVEEIVGIISGRLSHYPTVCLILLGRRKAVSSRFVYAVLSELNQIMLSRPEMLDQYLARPDEDDDEADDMFDEIWEWREEYTQKILAENKIQEREKSPLAEVLENLDQEMAELDPRLPLLFNPGLAEQELAGLNSKLKYHLTDDLITLYRWHNGLAAYESAPLLRGNYFKPLKDALVASRQTYAASTLPRHIMTIMRHDWGWLDIDLGERPEFKGLVCQVVTDEQDQPTIYPGLSAFFGALLAVFRQGAFRVESAAGPNGEDMLIGSQNTIDRIFNRFALMDSERPEYEGDDDDDTYDYSLPLPARS